MSERCERVEEIVSDMSFLCDNRSEACREWVRRLRDSIASRNEELEKVRSIAIALRDRHLEGQEREGLEKILKIVQYLVDGKEYKEGDAYAESIRCPYCGHEDCEVFALFGEWFVKCPAHGCGVVGPMSENREAAIRLWRAINDDDVREWSSRKSHEKWQRGTDKKVQKRLDCRFYRALDICNKTGGIDCPKDCPYYVSHSELASWRFDVEGKDLL